MTLPTIDSSGSPGAAAQSAGFGYRVVRALARFLLNLFYQNIEIDGAENVPASGPLVIAANHHNSIVDALLLVAVVPRPLRSLANAPLFRHPMIGPFLRLMGALPVHRRQEAGNDPAKNVALFEATTATLQRGGAILIFPEGRTQPEPVLQTVRTGAARMVLAASTARHGRNQDLNQDHRHTEITARRAATKNLNRNHRDTEIAEVAEKKRLEESSRPDKNLRVSSTEAHRGKGLEESSRGAMKSRVGSTAGGDSVTLLPVGLVYQDPGTFRAGRALVLFGSAIAAADSPAALAESALAEPPATAPAEAAPDRASDAASADATSERAARILTERLADALRGLIVEADDRQTLRLLGLAEELLRESGAASPSDPRERVVWQQRAMRLYRTLQQQAPERLAALRTGLEAYDADLRQAGRAVAHLSREYSPSNVVRFAVRELPPMLLGAPLALCGIAAHIIPYQVTALAVRLIPHTDEEEATDKIAAGMLFFPLAWAGEAYVAFALGGIWALILFLAVLLPTGFFALAWRERFERVGRETRAFFRFLRDRTLPRRLRERRQSLAADLSALADLAGQAQAGEPLHKS